jgi:hypothetical protein
MKKGVLKKFLTFLKKAQIYFIDFFQYPKLTRIIPKSSVDHGTSPIKPTSMLSTGI